MVDIKLIKCNENRIITNEQRDSMLINAEAKYGEFLDALGFDWRNDPNMKDTPHRVAKMYINELLSGCYNESPKITVFDNTNEYYGMIFEGNINVTSLCSHHMQPINGYAYLAYIPKEPGGKIIGLSKLNRIVDWFSRRPQIQENLTKQIADYLEFIIGDNNGIAVMIRAEHGCIKNRGVNQNSIMQTTVLRGTFLTSETARNEFYQYINNLK